MLNAENENTNPVEDELHNDELKEKAPEEDKEGEAATVDAPIEGAAGDGEAAPTDPEPTEANWLKDLRKRHKDAAKRVRELEEENQRLKAPAVAETLPVKPKLGDDGIDYDEEKFSSALEDYTVKKTRFEESKRKEQQAMEARNQERTAVYDGYKKKAAALGVDNYTEAEDEIVATLSEQQQAVLLEAVDNPAALVYKLWESPEKLHELKNIKSLPRFAAELGIMAKDMKQTASRTKPPPEAVLRGGTSAGSNASLDVLREKAKKTGDYSEYHAAIRKK